jgi:hypothetical protein
MEVIKMQRIIKGKFLFQYAENRKEDLIVYVYKVKHVNLYLKDLDNESIRNLKKQGFIDNDFYDELFLSSKDNLLQIIENY